MKFTEISFTRIKAQIEDFLKTEYGKASILFSKASPYGQILSVIENLHQLSMMYLKGILNSFDINNNSATNNRVVRNTAVYAGHNITRAISSSGTLKISVKPGSIDPNQTTNKSISNITLLNKLRLKNENNSLDYSLNLGVDSITYPLTSNTKFFINIIQGKWVLRTYTGTGEPLQTLSITEVGNNDIENFNIQVVVNGEFWIVRKHLYDMIPDERAVVVKTGFDGGIDVIFGNGSFGMIPPISASIEVYYLQTKGAVGNVYRKVIQSKKEWKFMDDVYDDNGNIINMDDIFSIETYTDINYGADAESVEFTRSLLPISSNNYVLALPQQYAYHIKKLGVFSHVNAYEKNGTIYISVTPNINLFKSPNSNYFNIDKSAFTLDGWERYKLDLYLRNSGVIQLTKKYKIVNPILSYYVMNIFIIPYSDAVDESLNSQIISIVSDYFLKLDKMDRIAKVDLLKLISNIPDIHSIDLQFISKKNEDYHRNGMIEGSIDYSPERILGIDPILGDIIFESDELPIIRGGWENRNKAENGGYYSDNIDEPGLKSINIFKNGTVDAKKRDNK
jgi:hypothetical protein